MRDGFRPVAGLGSAALLCGIALAVSSWATEGQRPGEQDRPRDAIAEAQSVRDVPATRPEQKKTEHDRSKGFDPPNIPPSSKALEDQPEKGQIQGFDFARDPLDAKQPLQSPEEIMATDMTMKPMVMAAQAKLLAS